MRSLLLLLLVCLSVSGFSQVVTADRSVLDKRTGAGMYTEIKPKLENPNARAYYMEQQWQLGNIEYEGEKIISNQPLKYDIVRQWMEIKMDDEIMVLPARTIDSFEWFNNTTSTATKFIKTRGFEMDGDIPPVGFFEVLFDGEVQLLSHKSVQIFHANSSVSVSGSHRSHNIVYLEHYYLAKGNKLYKLHKKRKHNLYLFGDKQDQVVRFARKKGLLFSRRADLQQIFLYYNSLI